jgi:hypothetical protein
LKKIDKPNRKGTNIVDNIDDIGLYIGASHLKDDVKDDVIDDIGR